MRASCSTWRLHWPPGHGMLAHGARMPMAWPFARAMWPRNASMRGVEACSPCLLLECAPSSVCGRTETYLIFKDFQSDQNGSQNASVCFLKRQVPLECHEIQLNIKQVKTEHWHFKMHEKVYIMNP